MSNQTWIQTIWHFDSFPERIFRQSSIRKKLVDDKNIMINDYTCFAIKKRLHLYLIWDGLHGLNKTEKDQQF